ncbi:MAG: hypothetical protein RIQ33_1588, partial [Bacteroidota bacterium]
MNSINDTIWNCIEKRKQTQVGLNIILELFNHEQCLIIEQLSQSDKQIEKKMENIKNLLRDEASEYSPKDSDAFDIYNEILVYKFLRDRWSNISFCPTKKNNTKTPDYILKLESGTRINLELKNINIQEPNESFRITQKEQQISHIDKKSAYTFKPFKQSNRKTVIEALITKISSSIKQDQLSYEGNQGILIVDLIKFGHFPL